MKPIVLFLTLLCSTATGFSTPRATTTATSKPSITPNTIPFEYTHLELNGMIWKFPQHNTSLVIDPIATQLNFGIPWGYQANKAMGKQQTLDLIVNAQPTHCLLSQGLDDHCHLDTLQQLIPLLPDLQFIVAPSAQEKMQSILPPNRQLQVLAPGQSLALAEHATLQATSGALVGPPWQARENGWLLTIHDKTIYTEPHSDIVNAQLKGLSANLMIAPVVEQALPAQVPKQGQYTLVHGGGRTLEIAQLLGVSQIIPLANESVETSGPLAGLVAASGSADEFQNLVQQYNARVPAKQQITVQKSTPGQVLRVDI